MKSTVTTIDKNFKNPKALPFPQDPSGTAVRLRAGGVAAASQIGADPVKLERFLETLKVLAKHAKTVHSVAAEKAATAKVNAAGARARVAEKRRAEAEARAKEHEAAAERVRAMAGIKPVEAPAEDADKADK